MKALFIFIIAILVVLISLLFYVSYKILKLNVKATSSMELDHVDCPMLKNDRESKTGKNTKRAIGQEIINTPDFANTLSYNKRYIKIFDRIDIPISKTICSKRDPKSNSTNVTDQSKLEAYNYPQPPPKKRDSSKLSILPQISVSLKEKPSLKLSFQYSSQHALMKVIIRRITPTQKAQNCSSEAYVDCQVSPYRSRTYRCPGYRVPARAATRRPIDFKLEGIQLKTHYFLVFLFRYNPFSELKVDGEAIVKFSDLNIELLKSGHHVKVDVPVVKSQQNFIAFGLKK